MKVGGFLQFLQPDMSFDDEEEGLENNAQDADNTNVLPEIKNIGTT